MIQQSHLFNSVPNSVILSTFTCISHSTVPHIQQCNKFNSLIWFNSVISFNSSKYSTFSKLSFIIYFHHHIPINSPNNVQQCSKFNIQTFLHYILFNSSMYSIVQQNQCSFLGLHSHLFQQEHLFNSVTNSVVLSNF